MKKVVLERNIKKVNGTFGILRSDQSKWFTVERPWLDNQNNISCIPIGTYVCKWTLSPRLKKFTYEVTGVPKRAGIRIHSANFPNQVLGCLSLGKKAGMMDGKRGVFLSVTAVREFNDVMNKEIFQLEIK